MTNCTEWCGPNGVKMSNNEYLLTTFSTCYEFCFCPTLISTKIIYYFCPKKIYCMYSLKKNNSHFIFRCELQLLSYPSHHPQGFLEPASCLAGAGSQFWTIFTCASQLCPFLHVLFDSLQCLSFHEQNPTH